MATVENIAGTGDLRATLMAMDEPELAAQQIVQQGAVHALTTLLDQGCFEQTAQDMLASLRSNMLVIEAVARDKGFKRLFAGADGACATGGIHPGGNYILGEQPSEQTVSRAAAGASPRAYSLDAPDQQRLKIARAKIEGILKEHDLGAVVVLHTPGMTEFFYDVTPSYSCVWIDEAAGRLRMKSKLSDHGGDKSAQLRDQAATANMIHGLAGDLESAAGMFGSIAPFIDRALCAEHTERVHTPDPMEARKQ